MASIASINLGIVTSENQSKDSGIFQQPLPQSDADNAILLDVFGCFRTITVVGNFEGTITEQRTFIDAIEGICDGSQVSSDFVSSLTTDTKKVFIQTFSWDVIEATPSKISYTLTLLQGRNVVS